MPIRRTRDAGPVPDPLARIVGRCLEKSPANRFQTAADLRFALETIAHAPRNAAPRRQAGRPSGREYVRAVEAGRQAVRIDPELARGHYARGIALTRAGQVEEGRLAMQRSIELDSNLGSAMQNLAMLELNAGRLDQAAYWAMRAWPLWRQTPRILTTAWLNRSSSWIWTWPSAGWRLPRPASDPTIPRAASASCGCKGLSRCVAAISPRRSPARATPCAPGRRSSAVRSS